MTTISVDQLSISVEAAARPALTMSLAGIASSIVPSSSTVRQSWSAYLWARSMKV